MFLRDVLKRWGERPADAANSGSGVADACGSAPSLLEELAADPEDFAELAAVLKLDLQAVITALVHERPRTPAELVERLVAHESSPAAATPRGPLTAADSGSATAPLVWARVALDRRGAVGTVYAGWLTPGAVEEIAGAAGAGGSEIQIEITVALADDEGRLARVRELCAGVVENLPAHLRPADSAPPRRTWLSWGGGGEIGWGRWTRARGGARVHRGSTPATVRPAMVAS